MRWLFRGAHGAAPCLTCRSWFAGLRFGLTLIVFYLTNSTVGLQVGVAVCCDCGGQRACIAQATVFILLLVLVPWPYSALRDFAPVGPSG